MMGAVMVFQQPTRSAKTQREAFLIPGITRIPIAIASMCGAFTYMNG